MGELSAGDPFGESDMLEATDSVEAVASVTDGEKSLLENVFRRNIELQKLRTDDAVEDEDSL